jgi:hypothetical protein
MDGYVTMHGLLTGIGLAVAAVSVLKPLCGHEYGFYQQLRSVCVQDYPDFQIVLGLQNPHDSALPAVQLLKHHFDALEIDCVQVPPDYVARVLPPPAVSLPSACRWRHSARRWPPWRPWP